MAALKGVWEEELADYALERLHWLENGLEKGRDRANALGLQASTAFPSAETGGNLSN